MDRNKRQADKENALRREQKALVKKQEQEKDQIRQDYREAGRHDVTGGKIAYQTLRSHVDLICHIEHQKQLQDNSEQISKKQEEYRKLLSLI